MPNHPKKLTSMRIENVPTDALLAAKHYRDKLGWAPHPLRPPQDKSIDAKARGKAPLLPGWKNWTPEQATDPLIEKYFAGHSTNNLGIVLQGDHVVIDLDSKVDRGSSVSDWLQNKDELRDVPRERTGGGAHLHFICKDLPGKPQQKKLTTKINDSVTAELFCSGLNLVISPSVHQNGHRYHWEVEGEIPEVTWSQLVDWFGFSAPAAAKPRGRPKKERPWWADYRGNLETLDLVALFNELVLYGQHIDGESQKHSVLCPWRLDHSDADKSKNTSNSSTVIFTPDNAFPAFVCLHAHCNEKGLQPGPRHRSA